MSDLNTLGIESDEQKTSDIRSIRITDKNWEMIWKGMPEYISDNLEAKRKIVVKFKTLDDFEKFKEKLGLTVSHKMRSTFYPPQAKTDFTSLRWVDNMFIDEHIDEEEFDDDK